MSITEHVSGILIQSAGGGFILDIRGQTYLAKGSVQCLPIFTYIFAVNWDHDPIRIDPVKFPCKMGGITVTQKFRIAKIFPF